MTVRELGSAMVRRWYVVVLALIVAVAGNYLLQRSEGVYATETVVSFILPDETRLSPNSGLDDASVIAFAGVVARAVNSGKTPAIYSIYNAPLYGAGVRQGVVVSLPNAGNQFATSYQRAEVVLQIVGPTEQWVAQKQSQLLAEVVAISDAQQASVTPATSRIRASPAAPTMKISHVVPSRSTAIAALVALLVAAVLVGGWAAVTMDRAIRGRKITANRRVLVRVANEGPER
jgi:hypothetical protein